MTAIICAILPILPLALWCGFFLFSLSATEGETLLRFPIPLLARLKMLSMPTILIVIVWMGLLALDRVNTLSIWIALAGCVIVLCWPQSYLLTTLGIRMGKGPFRRWTEFSGVARSGAGAVLQGGPRASSYPIFLSGSREDDEFVQTLRTLIRNAYKGKSTDRADLVRA